MRRPVGPVLAAGALVLGAAVAAGFGTLGITSEEPRWRLEPAPQSPPAEPSPPPPPPVEEGADSGVAWLGPALLGVALLVLAGLFGLLVWLLVRRLRRVTLRPRWLRLRGLRAAAPAQRPEPAGSAEAEELVAAVSEAVSRSGDERDPRRAVIACWVRLTEAAEQAGVPRHRSDTATDLVVRLLRGHRVSEPALAEFAEVYRRARYAVHPVDERMRAQARAALERLRAELAEPAPTPAPDREEVPG